MPEQTAIEYIWTLPGDERAKPLLADLAREYGERYGEAAGFEMSRYPIERFDPGQGGAFLLLIENGRTIAGGAFMRTDDTTAEVKRVWTSPSERRRGLSRAVMTELAAEAVRRGYRRIELTTGYRQPEAVALYLSLGYTAEFDLDGDLDAIGYLPFTKDLSVEPA